MGKDSWNCKNIGPVRLPDQIAQAMVDELKAYNSKPGCLKTAKPADLIRAMLAERYGFESTKHNWTPGASTASVGGAIVGAPKELNETLEVRVVGEQKA